MKKVYITMLVATAASLMVTGCKSSEAPATTEPAVQSAPAMVVPGATVTEDGAIVFSAEGQSVCVTLSPLSVAKAELAAATVAKANLLEVIKGALVSGSAKVSNLMLVEQSAEKTVSGWLSRATVEIIPVEEVAMEETKLPVEPVMQPKERVITAIATLILSEDDLAKIKPFVE